MTKLMTRNGRDTVPAEAYSTERSLGDWMRALSRGQFGYLEERYHSKAALATSGGLVGGYTVPIDFVKGVLANAHEASFFLQKAYKVPLGSTETLVPYVSVSSGAAGVSPFFGGVVYSWGTEGAALTETEPTFTSVAMKAHTLQGYSIISNQLLDDLDASALTEYLTKLLGEAAGWYFDYACFSGNGVGKPLGVVHAPGRITLGSGTLTAAIISEMASKLLPGSWKTAVWAMHPNQYQVLNVLSTYLLNTERIGQLALYSRPIILTEKLPASGLGSVVLFDPQLYLVGVRQEVEVSISRHEPTLYLKGQSAIRMVCRGDGQPRLQSSVVLADGTETASAYVVLT